MAINNYIDLPTSDATVPSGSATSANQVLEIAQLMSINAKLTPPLAVIGPLTNAELRASPVPVTGTVAVTGPLSVTQGTVPWIVDGSGFTQPISALSLPLPSGASTSALQLTGNASLASIDSKLTSPIAVTGPLTDAQLRATPVPVSGTVTANQGTSPWVVSGTITTSPDVNIHDSAGNALSSTGTSLNVNVTNTVPVSGPLTDAQLRATPVPVSLTSTTITGTVAVTQSTSPWVVSGTVNSSNFPATVDTNYGTVGANTIRTASQIGNATGAANFNAGATGAQTLRVVANLNDGSANSISSQANGAQRALDVGINVAGVQIDPRAASPGTLTDRSGTATTTSAVLAAANSARKYLFIQNLSAGDIWINFTTTATAASPSIRVDAGNIFTMEGNYISTEAINVRSTTLTRSFTAKEG